MKRTTYNETASPIVRELSEIFDAVMPNAVAKQCGRTREWLMMKMLDRKDGTASTKFVAADVPVIRAALKNVSDRLSGIVPEHGLERDIEASFISDMLTFVRKNWMLEQMGMSRNQWYERACDHVHKVDVRFTKEELRKMEKIITDVRLKLLGASLDIC